MDFTSEHLQELLDNRYVLIIGDSVQRGIYKDIVSFLQEDDPMKPEWLKSKGELSHCGDELIEGGVLEELTNKKTYKEVRQYVTDYHLVRFYFVTRCYSDYMETIFLDIERDRNKPDVVIMNSCIWDVSRYGKTGIEDYQINMQVAMMRFQDVLPDTSLFIWNVTLPVSDDVKGGVITKDISFMREVLKLDIMVGNYFAQQIVNAHNFDVLDLHSVFRGDRKFLEHRESDGIHWDSWAHRRITSYILMRIYEAWDEPLPRKSQIAALMNSVHKLDHGGHHQRSYSDNVSHMLPLNSGYQTEIQSAGQDQQSPLAFNEEPLLPVLDLCGDELLDPDYGIDSVYQTINHFSRSKSLEETPCMIQPGTFDTFSNDDNNNNHKMKSNLHNGNHRYNPY